MVFGFGFNKAKTFASAEKSVKQGKLHNAIADYEKISKEDPRDLNVLNTLGDLYARVGDVERATECFKRCGEAYAGEGFTVKAIAMYKKVTKQNPSATEAVAKLAELYAQHGLYNDARMQYSQVVEHHLRDGRVEPAIAVLQKILEFDPENAQLQGRMADLYVRLGKTTEARDLYLRTAQALQQRGTLDGCDKALAKVLELEPGYTQAILLRGQVKLEVGDAAGAVQCLESLPDIDSRPEALRLLLRAYLKLGNREEAEPLARKLLTIYNDPAGISEYVELLLSTGQFDAALELYSEYADRIMSTDGASLVQTLHSLIGRVKDHARSLETLSLLFQKAGDTTHLAEVTELLAHASVQEGELEKARDLYQRLSEMEPENPIHLQNYRQIMARLGQDSSIGSLGDQKGAPAFLMDELTEAPAGLEQEYPPEVKAAIQEALTDAELFSSYNLPARAIPLLTAALTRAPKDAQLNQRLAGLYSRTGQLAEASQCCAVLRDLYEEAGLRKEASEYAELAASYREQSGLPPEPAAAPGEEPAVATSQALPPESDAAEQNTPSDSGNAAPRPSEGPTEDTAPLVEEVQQPWAMPPVSSPEPAAATVATLETQSVGFNSGADAVAHEIDLSEEWDRVLNAEELPDYADPEQFPALIEPGSATLQPASPWDAPAVAARPSPATAAAVGDLVEEVRFYISQSMWNEARMALTRAEAMVPGAPAVVELRAQLAAQFTGPTMPEPVMDSGDAQSAFEVELTQPEVPEPEPLPSFPEISFAAPPVPVAAPVAETAEPVATLDSFVASLEQSLGADFAIEPPEAEHVVPPVATPAVVNPEPESSEASAPLASLFEEFKRDMESTTELSDDVETHYNLGLAFKEMGLFDEAIAELQKAASAMEQGAAFPQVLETYTWLADCFVNKGLPEAGAHWFKKALAIPGLSPEQALAVNYELACAEEAAGDLSAARMHFMHVLSLNIDYRDVAERIKALKS